MKSAAEYVLSFLVNSAWQVAFIAAMAMLADFLLRRSAARYRHWVWVAALLLSLLLPLGTSIRGFTKPESVVAPLQPIASESTLIEAPVSVVPTALPRTSFSALQVGTRIAATVVALFLLFVGYRTIRLMRAWLRTRSARQQVLPFAANHRVHAIVTECRRAIRAGEISLMSSEHLRAPATVGTFRPLVILPETLAREASDEELMAAVGHELVHVWRRDYLMNLIYEFIFLPLSFHPAAMLMRRRITQTRELRCDELVSELLLHPEVYARSLVQLAHSAMPLARRPRTVAVGITDADILEVRVMSLLQKTRVNRKRVWLIAAAVLLALPCVAAASFAFHLNIDTARAQEPSQEEKRKVELRRLTEQQVKEELQQRAQKLEQQIKSETNGEVRANLERELTKVRAQMERPLALAVTSQGEGYVMLSDPTRARQERELQEKHNTILAQMAKISMDQAIQIATSKIPGKVTECSLVGERWSAPGELAKPSQVLYHVVILSGDESAPVINHVLVNAIDGTIVKSERAEPRREMSEIETGAVEEARRKLQPGRAIEGGVLNSKATELPVPQYPDIARAAKASGNVQVKVLIDESGNVIGTEVISGHPLLRAAAESAAREAKFSPTRLSGEPVKVTGTIVYNFVAQ